ncbi:MAG: ASKHA domain-containing protein, partial [Desulfatiglandales bacterium]
LQTIGGLTPKGICGSGVISALASFLKAGLISKTGRLSHKIPSSRLREGEEGLEILLYRGEGGEEVVITEKEIGEVMLAKGAIKAGIQVLKRHWKGEEISQVTVTGSFGASLGVSDLKEIGLIPLGVADTIETVENAAGIGACMALLGVRKRKEIEKIVSMMEYVELSQDPEFEELLVEGLLLQGG